MGVRWSFGRPVQTDESNSEWSFGRPYHVYDDTSGLDLVKVVGDILNVSEAKARILGFVKMIGETLNISDAKSEVVATEDFTAGDGTAVSALSNWSKNTTYDLDIWSNEARANRNAEEQCNYWDADEFEDDQYSEATINTADSQVFLGVTVRCAVGTASYYCLYFATSTAYDEVWLLRFEDGSWTLIEGNMAYAVPDGAVIRLEVKGTING